MVGSEPDGFACVASSSKAHDQRRSQLNTPGDCGSCALIHAAVPTATTSPLIPLHSLCAEASPAGVSCRQLPPQTRETPGEVMATTTPQASLALQQRVRRFLEEDVSTFVVCSTFGFSLYAAREYHSAAAKALPSTSHRLQRALRKTLPIVPAIVLSSAVGIIGMKLTLAAVQDARRDYSRTSVLISVPLFAALIHAPAGPRAMAKSALGYGAFILAADYAASEWHHYNAIKMEMTMDQAKTDQVHFDLHHTPLHFGQYDAHGAKPHAPLEQ